MMWGMLKNSNKITMVSNFFSRATHRAFQSVGKLDVRAVTT